jgi:YVTN family beta-propeller protein
VLLSRTTRDLVEDDLPPDVTIRDLGERRLKDLERPEPLSQLVIEGLPDRFGQLQTLDVELKRKRRRIYVGAALIGVIAAAVAIPVFALGQGSGEGGTTVQPNTVAIIDPSSNRTIGSVSVGIRPGPVAAAEGSVWVGNLDDRTLTRIDATRRAAAATVSLDRRTPTGLATGEGAVWVAHGRLGELSRVDPQFNQLGQTIDVTAQEAGGGAQQGSVAVGEGSVWAAYGDTTLARIEPRTLHVVATTTAGAVPAALVVARGSIWVANSGDSTVSRFNPATVEEGPVRVISVGDRPTGIAYGDNAIWVANSGDGTVTRIDPSTYSTATIAVGAQPVAVAADGGAVWVANAGDGTVSRIDPATNDVVRTIELGHTPAGLAVADELVWVAVQTA